LLPAFQPIRGDNTRNARLHKCLSHEFAGKSDGDISIWQDANFEMAISPEEAVARFLENSDIAAFGHSDSKLYADYSVYSEAEHCALRGHDDRQVLERQTAWYRAAGLPATNSLPATGVLLRRHTARTRRINVEWWREILNHSCRDQIALPWVLRDEPITIIPGDIYRNDMWVYHYHASERGRDDNAELEADPRKTYQWSIAQLRESFNSCKHLLPICTR